MRPEHLPDARRILGWIEEIFAQGVRRPGSAADRWAERFAAHAFSELGLERVRLEPVSVPLWEPRAWSLHARANGATRELRCFPLPYAAGSDEIELELAPFDAGPDAVRGKAALDGCRLLRVPPASFVAKEPDLAGRPGGRVLDPRGTFDGALQVLPFGPRFQHVMEPAIEAGAAAFLGVLEDYPGDGCAYYVPYDAVERPIPGLWLRGSDGAWLREQLDRGPVRVRLRVESHCEAGTCHNVVGELEGADEELLVVGTHHDGPWSSAVEDASGMALVLAQAAYWSQLPRSQRPHRLLFLMNAGHMAGGAGCRAFLEDHAEDLERIVLSLHLEHAANEVVEQDGKLVATGEPEPRWWFTSRIPQLESAVAEALATEQLDRSLVLPPDVFGPHPTTDGGFFHLHRVPLVDYLTAPFYLFDEADRMDKIHEPSLVPVTRAAIRLLESTAGVSAAALRRAAQPTGGPSAA